MGEVLIEQREVNVAVEGLGQKKRSALDTPHLGKFSRKITRKC